MKTTQMKVGKDEFVEFLEFACRVSSLQFSMDSCSRIWPSYEKGWSAEAKREYIDNRPVLLQNVADLHSDERPEGGRFRIDFQGAYSFEKERYFVLWVKSAGLLTFEMSIPLDSKKMSDLWAMMAKRRF